MPVRAGSFNPLAFPAGTDLYSDYLIGGMEIGRGASAPTIKAFRGSIEFPAFASSGPTEDGSFGVHILHDIKAGTTPTIHIHWGHTVAVPSGGVTWVVEITAAQGYESEAFGATTELTTTQTAGAQYAHHITDDDDMPLPAGIVSSLEPDMLLLCRVYRDTADVGDTFTGDAFLFQIDLHYQIGQIATSERNRPFTSAGF